VVETSPAPSPVAPPSSTPVEGEPPILARPATAVTVGSVTLSWMPRDSWVRYVSSGTGASDGVTPGGGATAVAATASPCSDRPSSSSAALDYTTSFPAKESWYDPFSGEAGIYGSGDVAFRYTAHTINLTAAEPEIEINGSASRAIFRFVGSGGTPYPNQRVALETLETAGRPTVSNGLLHAAMTDYIPQNPDDPVSQGAGRAIAHLNADHADSLLDMARALAGCDAATAARCLDADRIGLTLLAATPSGDLTVRIPYDEPIDDAEGLRKATVKLAHRARAILAG
jgi:hypothetical protein